VGLFVLADLRLGLRAKHVRALLSRAPQLIASFVTDSVRARARASGAGSRPAGDRGGARVVRARLELPHVCVSTDTLCPPDVDKGVQTRPQTR